MTNESSDNAGAKPRRASAKVKAAAEAAADAASQAAAKGARLLEIDEAEARRRLQAAIESVEARAEELKRWGAAKTEDAREIVEERPLTVLASAFGVGLLIGLLAGRL